MIVFSGLLIYFVQKSIRNFIITMNQLRSVTRYLATCRPEDEEFDSHNTLKHQIDDDELKEVVSTIENKFSLGLMENRQKHLEKVK